ncbi:MAG: TorF family putative porin [Sulfurimonas sp.]|uniref:TorF family putative porin n=1 Tax=Sulfurimonas sp. TaxID=2022749 RepID=UPI002638F280|nr:TorF family putative porin [Sulfurimonas sp.]MCW8895789.1 TorF family putative porin [Sulfurimonas sp.]MCW8953395.1 TorF family putative porin [Sulfurimonas sp.]MCW9067484.1 TorF family putative porin [Sulfurimonas sp.]
MKLIKLSLAAALITTIVFAEEEKSEIGISANMAITSNYVWRGMTQTQDSPAVQGGVDLDYKGFYVGVWGSNVNFNTDVSVELDFYGGYTSEIAGIGFDIGFIEYAYPKDSEASNFGEAYIGLSKDWDKFGVSAKYSFGVETNTLDPEDYVEVGASAVLPYEVELAVGYGDYDNTGTNYSVGLSKSFEKFDLGLAYIDFNHDTDSTADEDNVVATISFSF